jgi:hypothetical protein
MHSTIAGGADAEQPGFKVSNLPKQRLQEERRLFTAR